MDEMEGLYGGFDQQKLRIFHLFPLTRVVLFPIFSPYPNSYTYVVPACALQSLVDWRFINPYSPHLISKAVK